MGIGKKRGAIFATALCVFLLAVFLLPQISVSASAEETVWNEVTVPNGGFSSVEDGALEGWQFYFHDGTNFVYDSDHLRLGITQDGYEGNAMLISRTAADDEFVVYSYAIPVKPSSSYRFSYRVKAETAGASDKLMGGISERAGAREVYSAKYLAETAGATEGWVQKTADFTTGMAVDSVVLKFSASGIGEWAVDDIQLFEHIQAPLPEADYSLWYKGEGTYQWNDPQYTMFDGSEISTESSDGDGASLKLEAGKYYRIEIPKLPYTQNTYTLRFKYKGGSSASWAGVRIDNYGTDNEGDRYYAGTFGSDNQVTAQMIAGQKDDWTVAEYQFRSQNGAGTNKDVTFVEFHGIVYGEGAFPYLVDEITITDESGMQYVAQGSFADEAYTAGYGLYNGVTFAEQTDGSYVFFGGSAKTSGRGYLTVDISSLNPGEEYTISFDVRGGCNQSAVVYGANAQGVYDNSYEIATKWEWQPEWTEVSGKFTPSAELQQLQIYFDSGTIYNSYIRNIQITDAEGNEYIVNQSLKAEAKEDGSNLFAYGAFNGAAAKTAEGWTLSGGAELCGNTAQGGEQGYCIQFNGAGSAVSDEITVSGNLAKVTFTAPYGNVTATLLAGEQELSAQNGEFVLPEGTQSVRIKLSVSEGYATADLVGLQTHSHVFDINGEHKDATCEEDGYDVKLCSCGEEQRTTLIATGHQIVENAAKEAACSEPGNIRYWSCSACGKYFSDPDGENEIVDKGSVIVAAKGHTLTKTEAKEATCTEAGNIEYYTCSVCGKLFSDAEGKEEIEQADTVVAAKGHTLTKTEAKEATCTEAGNIEYYTCSVCGKLFSDAEGKEEIEQADTVVAAKGHTLTKTEAKEATCTEAGNIEYYTCSVCDKLFSDAEGKTEITQEQTAVAAKGHDYKDGVCTVCGAEDPAYVAPGGEEPGGGCSGAAGIAASLAAAAVLTGTAALLLIRRKKNNRT